jgi:flagellar hook protein FlgE
MSATSTAIDVVGNNLANLNTTGFKASTLSFHDMVAESMGAGSVSTQVGLGTAPPTTVRQFTQGEAQPSTGPLDAAIQGDGFFVVHDVSSGQTLYTRAGEFQLDASGNLLTSAGQHVQGWNGTNGTVDPNGPVGDITLPVEQLQMPIATTEFTLNMNLNSAAAAASSDAKFSTSVQTMDSLGNPVLMTVTFTKDPTVSGKWSYQVTIPGDATTGGAAGTPTELLATPGTLQFDAKGLLTSPAAEDGGIALAVTGLSDGAADLNVTWNLFDPKTSKANLTQFAQASAVAAVYQNGDSAAQLIKVSMSDGGTIVGKYSNGSQVTLAQLALASIRNPTSLVAVGDNNYRVTADTSDPAIGTAGAGGRGDIVGGALEGSTVDIATEFTNLIRFQRAYQANSKVVTTIDQMSQETIGLKQG